MKRQRLNAEQWHEILDDGRETNQTEAACAVKHGVGVASLRNWRKKVGQPSVATMARFIEIPAPLVTAEMRIQLGNGIVITVGQSWPTSDLVQVTKLLRSL